MKHLYLVAFALLSKLVFAQDTNPKFWKKLDTGLFVTEYTSLKKSTHGNSVFTILKIDPKVYDFSLFSAKEKTEYTRTAPQWAKDKKQIAIINAGMYQMDHATNLGYMKDFGFTNNARVNKNNTIVAFNRIHDTVPEFQIIDRTCQNWEVLKNSYQSFSQSIRMIDCNQKNRWSQQKKRWSTIAIGTDKKGNALFIISRSPYSVHDFNNILLKAPLNINKVMYLEGGPEASFYLNHPKKKIEIMGSYETGFNENDRNNRFWKIPNVIGISKK